MTTPRSTAMSPQHTESAFKERFLARMLDPIDRLIEAIYSVLIVMTFTLGVNVIKVGLPEEYQLLWVRSLFWAAFGCAVAWGLIDGIVYVRTSLFERGDRLRVVRKVQAAPDEAAGKEVVAAEMTELLLHVSGEMRSSVVDATYARLKTAPLPRNRLRSEDWGGALAMFLVAVTASLPVALPLLLVRSDPQLGVRLSNLVACATLFILGYRWARYAGSNPWTTGLLLLAVGVSMVAIAVPLGG